MKNQIKVTIENDKVIEVPYKTKAVDAVKKIYGNLDDVLAFNINNEVKNYDYELVMDSKIEFIKYLSDDGYKIYARTLKMILYMALTSLYSNADVEFMSTINKDQYFVIQNIKLTDEKIETIKQKMIEIIKKDLPITKKVVPLEEAFVLYTASNDIDKLENM